MKPLLKGTLAQMRDMFLSVSNRVNGFEHTLARRSAEFQRRKSVSKYAPHQGSGEMERRRRQIERGQLNASNGLEVS